MRYRKLTTDGDYSFGHSQQDFLINTPECVAQAVRTRLLLPTNEWFLDVTEGTPYAEKILGNNTQGLRDAAIKQRILGTPGVVSLDVYASSVNPATRAFSVSATITTLYGTASIPSVVL